MYKVWKTQYKKKLQLFKHVYVIKRNGSLTVTHTRTHKHEHIHKVIQIEAHDCRPRGGCSRCPPLTLFPTSRGRQDPAVPGGGALRGAGRREAGGLVAPAPPVPRPHRQAVPLRQEEHQGPLLADPPARLLRLRGHDRGTLRPRHRWVLQRPAASGISHWLC